MAPIKKLPPDVSAKIAAGEVIERPSNVVKELIENSLDAGSTRLSIELVDGGKALVRVEDNGIGIPASELPLAVESFSTSKIAGIDDIAHVRTLGFRGEALASIRAVSNFTIRSRARTEEIGRELKYRGEEMLSDGPCARSSGTETVIENLFFNLPARKKFLRSGPSELRRTVGILQGYALSFPEVSFILKDGGRDILSYPTATIRERIEVVLGGELFSHLLPVDHASGTMSVHGFASVPDLTRANRYMQFYYVNRRFVKDRVISHAVNQAYQSRIAHDRFPAIVLFLDVPPEEVDVNVHPTKAEVRFRSDADIHRLVLAALDAALKGKAPSFEATVASVYRSIFPGSAGGSALGVSSRGAVYPGADFSGPQGNPPEEAQHERAFEFHEAPLSLFGEGGTEGGFAPGRLYWQLHESFILIQIRGGMVIIDQHAAHERILFDAARNSVDSGKHAVQSLLFPATMELSPDEYQRYEELSGLLASLGFEIEPFGLRSIIVRGIPAGVRNWSDGRLLQEVLGGEGTSGTDDFLKTYACRAAVKAGMKLSSEEMESLADQLFATDLPYTCPHGRPTMLRVSLGELERRFARTVSNKT
jgi:DNA mismatch repair protein MutL